MRRSSAYWAGTGLRVNTLTLGGVEADHDSEFVKRYSERTPMGRMARPAEIASVVAFLAGDGGSYLTATTVFADGGIMHSSPGL